MPANPGVLTVDTMLYCPAEPEGRLFPAGSEWPGDAWSTNPGGAPIAQGSVAQAAKDLIAAQDRNDALAAQIDRLSFSLAERSAERDEAAGKVAALEQRAIAAETAQKTAEDAARGYMTERDAARADAKRFSDDVDKYRPEAEKVPGLVEQLNTANQALADAQTAAKARKGAKTADAAAPEAQEPAPAA